MDGFTYNGVHCSTYGIEYLPDPSARWFDSPEFQLYKKDINWRNGGYYYGNSVEIREIRLECYFEEISIATREQIRKWLGRDTSGNLVFDERPFVYYKVRPKSIVTGKLYNDINDTYSGTLVIEFIAVDPFGYLTRKSNTGNENDNAEDYCGIKASADMPAAPTTSGTSFDVYNPGTEQCGLKIALKGSCSNAIRFFNERNNTRCVISSLPTSPIELRINGDTGLVTVYSSGIEENGFAHHDYGFIRLEPDVGTSKNHIVIQEKNSQGNWVTPTTLSLTSISIDYDPRLL